jgi:uncharacterized protein (DUF2147 family)
MAKHAARVAVFGILLSLTSVARAAAPATPAGTWVTIDDNTGKPKGIVRITEQGGVLSGVVVKNLVPDPARPDPVCDQCSDDRKDRKVIGLEIIRGMRADGDEWDGGTILDPQNGKVYKCTMSLEDGGKTLAVRGYLGISLLGRTQRWQRQE